MIPTVITQELADWIQYRGSHWTRCTREDALAYARELEEYEAWAIADGAGYGVWR